MLSRTIALSSVIALTAIAPAPALAQPKPTVVVIANLAPQETASLLQDAITEKLVSSGRFEVVDRAHLQQVLGEQATSAQGQVLPGTEATVGRMVGANYMLIAKLRKLESFMERRGGVFSLNMYAKADMLSTVQVLEVRSGRVLQLIDDEEIAEGPGVPITTQNEANENAFANQYLRELMPKLAAKTAEGILTKLDTSRMGQGGAVARLQGRVIDASGGQIVVSLGDASGVSKGMTLGVYSAKRLRNPDSGKVIETYIQRGVVVITQVEHDYSVAKKVSGTVANSQIVRREQ